MEASGSNISDVLSILTNLNVVVFQINKNRFLVNKIVQVKCFLGNKIFSAVLRNASQYGLPRVRRSGYDIEYFESISVYSRYRLLITVKKT